MTNFPGSTERIRTDCRLAAMQPYLFPYIGYFQLIHAVDCFVLLDTVQYIVRGWINRNRYVVSGSERIFTLPLVGGSPNKCIDEILLKEDGTWKRKFFRSLQHSYRKTPYFDDAMRVIHLIFETGELNLSRFLFRSLQITLDYLGLERMLRCSSEIPTAAGLSGQARILAICNLQGADHYINLPGGRSLYERSTFERHGLNLCFLETNWEALDLQSSLPHKKPDLSMLDLMFWNSPEEIHDSLKHYRLEPSR